MDEIKRWTVAESEFEFLEVSTLIQVLAFLAFQHLESYSQWFLDCCYRCNYGIVIENLMEKI